METSFTIDTSFDFRSDTPPNKDPDTWSPSLSKHHKYLWSKPLPCGEVLHLEYRNAPYYLNHNSELGDFSLSSDTVIPTFWWLKNIEGLVADDELSDFHAIAYTIGGMMIFPANQIERRWTINQARGCIRKISDRFDLTVECIRRHYTGEKSPLGEVLDRYTGFFRLFQDFRGYVEFFFLHDLVNNDCTLVNFFLPFDEFHAPAVPQNRSEYQAYRTCAVDFINARNERIRNWAAHSLANERMESND